MGKLNEVFLIKEAGGKTVHFDDDEIDAILYCMQYADEKDDEGIRSSDPEAEARSEAMNRVFKKLGVAGGGTP